MRGYDLIYELRVGRNATSKKELEAEAEEIAQLLKYKIGDDHPVEIVFKKVRSI